MPLVHQLLSLALLLAPSRPAAPQPRAIDESAAVLEVEEAAETAQVDDGPTTADRATPPKVPHPSSGIGAAENTHFDTDPVYLGCGHLVPACENLNTVGMTTGGAGVALIAGSTALLLTPDQVIADEPAYVRNYTRAGTTLLALGIGLVTTGVLMVLTSARASHSRRVGPSGPKTTPSLATRRGR